MGRYILLTVHTSMFETIQESPASSEPLMFKDNSPPSSPTSLESTGSNAQLLPGTCIIVTPF